MMGSLKFINVSVFSVLLILFMVQDSLSTETDRPGVRVLQLNSWLRAGPVDMPLPALHATEEKTFSLQNLLKFEPVDVKNFWPNPGDPFPWSRDHTLRWESAPLDSQRISISQSDSTPVAQICYLATFMETPRWVKGILELKSSHLLKVYLDGESMGESTNEKSPDELSSISREIKMETGKHILVVKALRDPERNAPWWIEGELQLPEEFVNANVKTDLLPLHTMNLAHLLDDPEVQDVGISADGEYATVTVSQIIPGGEEKESWIELRRTRDGRLVETYRGGILMKNVRLAPKGHQFAYLSSEKEKSTLWLVDLDGGTTIPLLERIENLDSYSWLPDGTFIIYGVKEKAEKETGGLKRIETPRDRWPWWKDRTYLYKVNVPTKTRQRLTAGSLTTELNSISPDGNYLLFSREVENYAQRPYSKTELFLLNLSSLEADTLWKGRWFTAAQWSPDGKYILLTGGPSMFGDLGQNVPQGMIPNESDEQAYLMDIQTRKVEAITKYFNPEIRAASWFDNHTIYFTVTDRSYRSVYRYDLKTKKFFRVETGAEVVKNLDLAKNAPRAVYIGEGAATPPRAFLLNLKKQAYRELSNPGKASYQYVRFGEVKPWNFTNDRGTTIEGRIYYPPDFDASRKYPCIVYYYGGTSPVSRDFGGRYPKNYWAANGYVVYVLQPSGATGFGQEFSALHVNDWGKIVADEIIDGVQKFINAHPFIDKNRVGAIGASYGGFMTMLLLTKTDLFAAAVSHAGISSISSYWGEGYWGFLYSAIATAHSFPWNRPDIYIDQSALFAADKIKTPLLLLHGARDTNVPPGESTQLYTALKLLGRDVEYIQVEDTDHWVVSYSKRKNWTKTIMAWFDRWLKEQPQWWNDLYPNK